MALNPSNSSTLEQLALKGLIHAEHLYYSISAIFVLFVVLVVLVDAKLVQ